MPPMMRMKALESSSSLRLFGWLKRRYNDILQLCRIRENLPKKEMIASCAHFENFLAETAVAARAEIPLQR